MPVKVQREDCPLGEDSRHWSMKKIKSWRGDVRKKLQDMACALYDEIKRRNKALDYANIWWSRYAVAETRNLSWKEQLRDMDVSRRRYFMMCGDVGAGEARRMRRSADEEALMNRTSDKWQFSASGSMQSDKLKTIQWKGGKRNELSTRAMSVGEGRMRMRKVRCRTAQIAYEVRTGGRQAGGRATEFQLSRACS